MGKAALSAKADSARVPCIPDAAQLRALVTRILLEEYGSHGLWAIAARRAAGRIVEAIETVSR